MNKIDYLDIDGRLLRLFLLVYEERSVTKAAERLDVTQSAVSHGLEKLREILNDALFVRSGRGITPTHGADAMVEDVRNVLRSMRALSEKGGFDLETVSGQFSIASNDMNWGSLLRDVYAAMEKQAHNLDLRINYSGVDAVSLLRHEQVDLVLTPMVPEGSEFKQQKLYDDEFVCFYDAAVTTPPKTLDDYLSRRHARIVFSSVDTNPIDQALAKKRKSRRVALQVPNFAGLPNIMIGTDLIAVLPSALKQTIMRDFSTAISPIPVDRLSIYQVWHRRNDDRTLHKWMREQLRNIAKKI